MNTTERLARLERSPAAVRYPYFGANGQAGVIDDYLFDEDLILLGEDGVPFLDPMKSKAYRVRGRSWVNNHAHVLRARLTIADWRYVCFALNAVDYDDIVTGSTRLKLTQEAMRRIALPVAPIKEQMRIADKLDKLLARVDACQERLEIAKGLLRDFRTAVLHSAVTGVLSAAWRDNHHSSAWTDCVVGDMGAVSGGLTKNARRESMQLKRPYLRVANVHASRLELEDVAQIGGTEDEFNKTRLEVGDLLIVEGNGSLGQVGRVAMWRGELPDCSHQNHLIRWRAGPDMLPKFVMYWLMSPIGRQALMDRASSSSGLHTLSISKVRSVPISIPALAEQAEIVRRVEALFTWTEAAESRLAIAAMQVSNLPGAVLAKAFRGELVPQDPSDEPAQAMLDRLRAATSSSPGAAPKPRARRVAPA